jgi:rhodanese-related sulfurtransferase
MKTVFSIFICINVVSASINAQLPDSLKYQSLNPQEFQQKFNESINPILLDVREFFEFRKSRIGGAVNIPKSGGFETASDTISKESPLFFYCYSGGRSKKAAIFFYDKGFRKLYDLKGGITLWKKKGLPVVRKRPTSPSPVSQSSLYTFPEYQTQY